MVANAEKNKIRQGNTVIGKANLHGDQENHSETMEADVDGIPENIRARERTWADKKSVF